MNSMEELQAKVKEGFTDWEQYGNVRAVYKDDLVIFNYTHAAQYEGRWNWFERVCRGLILNTKTGEVVARPFDKFFNWGEREHYSSGHIVNVTEKIDGSLGILYRTEGQYAISTRGTFDSEQAQMATEILHVGYNIYDPPLPDSFTLLFEIVYPENRIVVDYGQVEDIYLLAVRNRFSGKYLYWRDVYELAQDYGFPKPRVFEFETADDIIRACKELDGTAEGWVAEFSDGQRFKFKGDTYLELHRLISNTSFKRVLSWVADGSYNAMIDGVPDEFLGQVREWKAFIDDTVNLTIHAVESVFHLAPKGDRKEFAIWVNANAKELSPYLFKAWDGVDYTPLIYQKQFNDFQWKDKDERQAD